MRVLAQWMNPSSEAVLLVSCWFYNATSLNTRKKRAFGLREYAEGKNHTSRRYFPNQL
jgi:hypothetical protein